MVHSYPQKPDLLALTSAIAMDIGEDITVTPENASGDVPTLPDVLSSTSAPPQPTLLPIESFQSNGDSHALSEKE